MSPGLRQRRVPFPPGSWGSEAGGSTRNPVFALLRVNSLRSPMQMLVFRKNRLTMRHVAHLDQIASVVQGEGATSGLEEVSASWRRCTADLLINPDSRSAPHIVTDSELRVSREP